MLLIGHRQIRPYATDLCGLDELSKVQGLQTLYVAIHGSWGHFCSNLVFRVEFLVQYSVSDWWFVQTPTY